MLVGDLEDHPSHKKFEDQVHCLKLNIRPTQAWAGPGWAGFILIKTKANIVVIVATFTNTPEEPCAVPLFGGGGGGGGGGGRAQPHGTW